jgi:pyruvate/2-oxoglutarate dehydrogenase complex dihydrolipoamide acyltransferase (E2) component
VIEVRLPQWGMGMKEGTIVEWIKAIGDRVEEGDVLAVVETEKVETELTSPATGTLDQIHVHEEETVPVGTLLAVINVSTDR